MDGSSRVPDCTRKTANYFTRDPRGRRGRSVYSFTHDTLRKEDVLWVPMAGDSLYVQRLAQTCSIFTSIVIVFTIIIE